MTTSRPLVSMARWLPTNATRWDRTVLLRRRRSSVVVLVILAIILAPYTWPLLYTFGDWIRQTNPWSEQYLVQQDFVSTKDELDCLFGRTRPATTTPPTETELIPNHVHFIFGLSNPYVEPRVGTFNFISYLAVRSAVVGMRAENISLHYTYLASPPSPEPNKTPFPIAGWTA